MRKIKDTERVAEGYFGNPDGMTLLEIENAFDQFANDNNVYVETVEISRDGFLDDYYKLIGIREETPAEKTRRETAARRRKVKAGERKKAKEEQERKEYERLKKKFGE